MPATAKAPPAAAAGRRRRSRFLKANPRPGRALLDRREQRRRVDQPAVLDRRLAPAEHASEEPRARDGHGLQPDVLAETLAHHRPRIAEAVDEAELERLGAGPDRAGEERVPLALEPPGPAALDERHEHRVDLRLDAFEAGDVLRPFRAERVEHRLAGPGRMEAALDAEAVQELVEAEPRRDDADRADERGRVGENLVAGAGQHIAAGRGGRSDATAPPIRQAS